MVLHDVLMKVVSVFPVDAGRAEIPVGIIVVKRDKMRKDVRE